MTGCGSSYSPFLHGVASGDPLADRVILWTRITPLTNAGDVEQGDNLPAIITYQWLVAIDPELTNLVLTRSGETSIEKDYTVKIDAVGLAPGTTYYYRFGAFEWVSDTGQPCRCPPLQQMTNRHRRHILLELTKVVLNKQIKKINNHCSPSIQTLRFYITATYQAELYSHS